MTVDADNALLTFAAGSNSQSIGGAHVYTADEIDIQAGAAITATGQIVTLQPNEAGELINIGSMGMAANDVLELSDAELDQVATTTIRIGRNDASAAGAVTISMTTTLTTATNLHVRTGSTVMQTAALTAANLAVSAGGDVTLNAMTNDVDTFAVATSAGDVSCIDIDGFSVGAVDSVNGVAAAAGNLSLTTIMGNLVVTNTPAANDVSASGTISLQVMGDDNTLTIASGANSASTGGDHSYVADKLALAGTISATGRIVTLTSNESGELVNLGSLTDAAADTLELSNSELSNIAASVLRIGNANTSVITVSQNVAAGSTTLSLATGSSIGGTAGITATNLALNAVGPVDLSAGSSDVDVLAASVTGANSAFAFRNSDGLTIGTADGIVGLTTNDANASITADGLLTIDDDIALGLGNAIFDTAGATQNAGDTINAAGLCLTGTGTGTFSLTEANDVDTLAASATGNISYSDIDALTVGTINAKVGITSGNGNVTITTGMALTIGDGAGQDINAGTGIVSLTVTLGGATEAAGSIITASQLRLSSPGAGAGAFDLDENNAVGLIAASINGQLDFVTTTSLDVSTSGAIVGVNSSGNNATIQSAGNLSLTQAITAAAPRVLLTSTAGAIVDANAGSNNITASALGLTAVNGIGSGNSIETAVSTLAATNSTTGNIEVTNVVGSLLTITTVGTIVGITNSAAAPAGEVTVTNGSPLTVAADVIAVGDIFLKALESVIPGAGDDLTVNAGVSIISTGGNVTLEAGDNVILTAGSIVTAAGSVSIKGDCGNNDAAGTTITINGTINSGTGATANGDTDSDTIIVGALGTGGLTLRNALAITSVAEVVRLLSELSRVRLLREVIAIPFLSSLIGFGYLTNLPQSLNSSQPISVTSTALYRDNHFGTVASPRTFQVQVKSGVNYDIRAYVGTQQSDLNNVEIRIEGVSVVAAPTTAFNFTTATLLNVVDTNADGLLSIEFVDAGGSTNLWAINGLDIAEVGMLPATAPLRAASISETLPASESNDPAEKLTQSQLDSAIQVALEFWQSAGLTASQLTALRNVSFTIEELAADNALGLAGSSVIKIDDDGSGLGWHTDFTSPVTPSQYDLATVVAHEMGHILGLGDLDPNLSPSELMTGELQPGERHIAMTDDFFRLLAETTEANWLAE